ncbi:hemoglobin-like flavoprotein [Pseudomonas alcaligenes]|uniref:Globin n=2 Tax=Pseudomonas TaxID=286 RepID=A0A6J4DZ84_9PSED|nr:MULTISPECIES: globin [Pseudomonas]MBB4820081.1 hemoglobin-like flavoprotein [Pseudomonas alcaligenes]MDU9413485.1 globin [Pseudomonas sp. zfem005]UXY53827.1 globin [Pseudomonas tohonis]BBP81272.1 globin [Pseudomonas sp. Pc102]BCG22807.1 globin [Pseudomonas tohonis]
MNATDRVMQSYGRCCANPDFFDAFYRRFLDSSPQIRAKFTETDMPAQKALLRQGILNLVMFARGMPDTKLRALGATHSREGFDIRPEMYDLWVESLLLTIAEHDKEHSTEVRSAWREVLNKGIEVIKSFY